MRRGSKGSKEGQPITLPSSNLPLLSIYLHFYALLSPLTTVNQSLTTFTSTLDPRLTHLPKNCSHRILLLWNHFLCFFWIINIKIQICSYYPIIKNPFHDSTYPLVTDPFFFLASLRRKKNLKKAYLCPLSPLLIFYSHINPLPIKLWSFSLDLFFVSHHWCSKWSGHSHTLFLSIFSNTSTVDTSFLLKLLFFWLPDSTHSWFSLFLSQLSLLYWISFSHRIWNFP